MNTVIEIISNSHLLLTDKLIWVLFLLALSFAVYASRHEHLRAPWRQVAQSRIGAASAVVLSLFVAIGLTDSIHFYPVNTNDKGEEVQSTELWSVFDLLVKPMKEHEEKTYSAPFATHSFVKETVDLSEGGQARVYPPLKYGGQHLEPGQSKLTDILVKGLKGAVMGSLLVVSFFLWFFYLRARQQGRSFGEVMSRAVGSQTALRSAAITALLLSALVGAAFYLSNFYHVWGTDKVGYDVFYITLKSIRTGLIIGTLTTLIMLPFALFLGMAAGYFRGWVDDVVQYLYTTLNSIPGVLLIAAAVLMLEVYMYNNAEQFTSVLERADWRLFFICLILGIMNWTGLCRLLRAETLKLREMDYVQAAHAFGVSHFRVMIRHLLPNVMHLVLISIVLDFSGLVLAEAVLSYVNIGVDPTTHSWGNMINSARLEMAREPIVWWSLAASFCAMFTLVLVANLFADVVRDAFDPRLRDSRSSQPATQEKAA